MPGRTTIQVLDPQRGQEMPVEVWDANSQQFAARLKKVVRERRKWAAKTGVMCYRVYDADLPDYAAAIDLYQGAGPSEGQRFAVVAEYRAPKTIDPVRAEHRMSDMLAIVPLALNVLPGRVFARQRRQEKGGGQYRMDSHKAHRAFTSEAGYLLEVDFSGYLDTGLFLDHRITRGLVGSAAAGKRFLNLFAYTGSASVHAAGGGAVQTTTVDMSQTYLDWARRNMSANGFKGDEHRFVRADVTDWIGKEVDSGRKYDLVFCDPPTFSNSKTMGSRTWSVQRDHAKLLGVIGQLLAPGGTIVFSCNLRGFVIDSEALEAYGLQTKDITSDTIPEDFSRNPRIHCCFLITR